jgi:hypothetical protein
VPELREVEPLDFPEPPDDELPPQAAIAVARAITPTPEANALERFRIDFLLSTLRAAR